MDLGLELCRAAQGFLGAPWARGGRDPGTGLDCLGLLLVAAREVGEPLPDPGDAGWWAWRGRFRELPGPAPGAILVTEAPSGPHLAIVSRTCRRAIQALEPIGVVSLPLHATPGSDPRYRALRHETAVQRTAAAAR